MKRSFVNPVTGNFCEWENAVLLRRVKKEFEDIPKGFPCQQKFVTHLSTAQLIAQKLETRNKSKVNEKEFSLSSSLKLAALNRDK
jgi:hypothetical protein